MSKIFLEATKNAPETVQIGHETANRKDGWFSTDNREFADYLIDQKFAVEKEKPSANTGRRRTKTAKVKTLNNESVAPNSDAESTVTAKETIEGETN